MNELSNLINEEDPEEIFELLDILGQGSYGSVSKALHKETGELYAIGILKECNDDHIVRYFGSYLKDGSLWIVMEYCIAGSITDIMQITKKKLNQFEIASILESALKGLNYIHSRKKIHRDIKAANILLDQKGNAKLADFGVSASSMQTNARFKTHIGSPYWMSPEIIKYTEYDYKTDIWSLGITAIELAEGQVPNAHIKPYMAIFAIKTNPVQSLQEPKLWSDEFNDFVKQCLALNPINRPEANELLEHAFIKKFSKGQRLLSELVLSSMQEIEEFRMNQSRNSSFGEIILDQEREYEENTKTLVENSDTNTVKQNISEPYESSETSEQEEELLNSMIILDSHRSNGHSYSGSVVEYKEQGNKPLSALNSYINDIKVMSNVEVECAKMLVKTLESYDKSFTEEIERIFMEYKEKIESDIKSLEELKKNNANVMKEIEFKCRLNESHNVKEFLCTFDEYLKESQNSRESCQNLEINSSEKLEPLAYPQMKTHQSTEEQGNDNKIKEIRKETKSFTIQKISEISESCAPFKKSYPNISNENNSIAESHIISGQSEMNVHNRNPNQHKNNSSRMMIKKVDQFNVPIACFDRIKYKEFVNDPDVMEYLQKEFSISSNTMASTITHTKSNFQPASTYTASKISTEICFREQRSTEQSISKSKNKSIKNIKSKKIKARAGN